MTRYILVGEFCLLLAFGLFCFLIGTLVYSFGSCPSLDELPVYNEWLQKVQDGPKQLPDRISEDQISVHKDKVVIVGSFDWAHYDDTNSMLPLLDYGSNGLYINVNESTDLIIGDVVSFNHPFSDSVMVHRIVDTWTNTSGTFYQTKGDNADSNDPFVIMHEDVLRVLIGVIY